MVDLRPKHTFIITPFEADYLSKERIRRVCLNTFIRKYLPRLG